MKRRSTVERGIFKEKINEALYYNDNIKKLLIGDTSKMSSTQMMSEFKKHVKSHLFLEDTVTEADMYIYYDVVMPNLHPQIEDCRITMYLICHRDMVDEDCNFEGYRGNRPDVLMQLVEEALLSEDTIRTFGIGELNLDSIGIYNGTRFYGYIMTFSVPSFR